MIPEISLGQFLPVVVTLSTALLVMIVDIIIRGDSGRWVNSISVIGVLLALYFAVEGLEVDTGFGFGGLLTADSFGRFFYILFAVGTLITLLFTHGFMLREKLEPGEYSILLLLCTSGMMIMVSSSDLIMLFLGIELMSIPAYILAGYLRTDEKSLESAIKYFLLGAFSTGVLLYGVALLYGATGTTGYGGIARALADGGSGVFGGSLPYIGMALVIAGMGFKVASVPFHMWMPDVYEGAPTPITGYMSVGVKAAAFAAFFRLLSVALPALTEIWTPVLWAMAVATMIGGNLGALAQLDVKRMLAYSSIAHAGYLLVGLVAGGIDGGKAVTFYLLAYTFMNLGAFGVILLLEKAGESGGRLADFSRLGYRKPVLAATMSVFLFSLAGIPPLAGFWGKFYIFMAAIKGGFIWLAILGVLNSAVAVYYYLRVVVVMYMQPAEAAAPGLPAAEGVKIGWTASLALLVAVIMIVHIGLFPGGYLLRATQVVGTLFGG